MYSGFRKYDTLLDICISYHSEKGKKREQIFHDICTVSYLYSMKPGYFLCVCVSNSIDQLGKMCKRDLTI